MTNQPCAAVIQTTYVEDHTTLPVVHIPGDPDQVDLNSKGIDIITVTDWLLRRRGLLLRCHLCSRHYPLLVLPGALQCQCTLFALSLEEWHFLDYSHWYSTVECLDWVPWCYSLSLTPDVDVFRWWHLCRSLTTPCWSPCWLRDLYLFQSFLSG